MAYKRSFVLLVLGALCASVSALSTAEATAAAATAAAAGDDGGCTRADSFSTTLMIEHRVILASESAYQDISELDALGTMLKDAYNSLNAAREDNKDVCDESLRQVTSVKVEPTNDVYEMYEDQNRQIRKYYYTVGAAGVGTTSSSNLLDAGVTRSIDVLSKAMQSPSGCDCSADVATKRAPTADELRKVLVQEFKTSKLQNVRGVHRVVEVQGGDCGRSATQTFDFDFEVELDKNFNDKDLPGIQACFKNAYNSITVNYCDPEHRKLSDVSLEDAKKAGLRKLQGGGGRLFGNGRGNCNNCGGGSGGFDDGNRRDLFEALPVSSLECYCSTSPTGYRAPTADEFQVAFNKELKNAYRKKSIHQGYECTRVIG